MDLIDAKLPGEKKNKKKKKPTLRFELDLPDSTGTTCPEYSYIDLVRTTLKEKKSKGENDIMCQNLLEEEEEKERNEAEAMAKYFEIKYGATAAGHKHKRKDKVRDLVGAGYGYDENDPFVDDSEAYDEIVPATLTTQHGGFYINTGQLNFRAVSDQSDAENSSSDDTMPLSHHITKKKKKKRHANLLETDESENEFKDIGSIETKKRKKKLKPVKDLDGKKKRKISINGKDKVTGLKKSKKIKKPTSLAQKLVAKAKAQQMMSASVVGSPVHQNIVSQNRKNSAELIRLGNKDLAQVAKQATRNLMNIGLSNDDFITEKEVKNGVDVTNDLSKNTTSSPENHELPPNLPQMLGDKIESLKKIAKSAEGEGKLKFFNNNVNRILLGIEESSQGLRTKERQGMYQHIAQHLPCSKDTLLKRVKKLQVNDSDQQLKGPIGKLKAAVDAVMTSQIEAYVVECDAKSDKFFDKSACAASTDEDEECEEKSLSGTLDGTEAAGEKVKRTYAPRRKFKWDDNLRKLLCDVVTVKMSLYERFKVREKQNPEEYLKAFLETTIKPLWPKPWMQTRILFKESRSAHHNLTFNSAKQKKSVSPNISETDSMQDISKEKLSKGNSGIPLSESVKNRIAEASKQHVKAISKKENNLSSDTKDSISLLRRKLSSGKLKIRHTPNHQWKKHKKKKKRREHEKEKCIQVVEESHSENLKLKDSKSLKEMRDVSPCKKVKKNRKSTREDKVKKVANDFQHSMQSNSKALNKTGISRKNFYCSKSTQKLAGSIITKPQPLIHSSNEGAVSPMIVSHRKNCLKRKDRIKKKSSLLQTKPIHALDTGSYKKVLGSAKDSNKAADIASGQKYVGTLNNSAGQSDTTAKSFKKQLIYETNDSKNYKPSVNAVSSRNSTTYSTNDKIKIGNLTSGGGFELVASIESENSPTSSPLSTQKKAPPSNEKVSTSSWKASNTSSIVKTKMPSATMLINPGSTKRVDKKSYSDKNFNRSFDSSFSSAGDVPLAMSSQAMESYASDIIKFMMDQNQLAHANPVYHGSPGLSNYDAISKILGLSPNDALPEGVKNSKQDEKLKFKISSAAVTPSSASKGGFPKLDVGTKRVATAIGPSWSSQNPTPPKISKPDKVPSIAKQKVCPPTSTAPVYSVTFDDKHAIKNLTMRPIPNFAVPSISSSNFSGQRSRSNQHHSIEKSTVSPNTPNFKIAQSAIDNLANIHNVPPMSPTFSQNTKRSSSTSCSVPIPKLQYSPSGASNIKLESIRGGFNPMLLSSMASSFNPNTNSFSTAYSSSSNLSNSAASKLKTMPVSSARNFPENYSMTDPQFSKSFPLVNLVDIQGNDSVKQAALNLNIKANQNR
uniref:ubinuclein-2-like isoform X1 n=1 Tax=Styela clava TaxID=7725 RepID=UPI00193A3BFB|nr:ubinuclein-2-like isoform X1 [Styela clava]